MNDPFVLFIGIALVGALAWALFSVNDGQKHIAEGIAHIIGNPTERERRDATKLAQSMRDAQASSKALIDQSLRQTQQQIELQQRTVFLLEQVLTELKDQSRQKA